MKQKQKLTLAEAKKKMIKSGLFSLAAVLVLIVATVAWFSSGTKVGVDTISAEISNDDLFITQFFESIDTNKDGVLDTNPNWTAVTAPDIDTGNLVPGQKMFYKIVVNSTRPRLQLIMNDITVLNGGSMSNADVLDIVKIKFDVRNQNGELITGISDFDGSMKDLYDLKNIDPDAATAPTITVYDIAMASIPDRTIVFYYTVGIPSTITQEDLVQGTGVKTEKIELYHD